MNRRSFLGRIGGSLAAALAGLFLIAPRPRERRRRRRRTRRIRRRVRRRHRRRIARRTWRGRRVWVVPVAVVVGWELVREGRVVVVKEVKTVEVDGEDRELLVVESTEEVDGKPTTKLEEIEVLREDTEENAEELPGSEIPDDDEDTPGVESEEETEDESEKEEADSDD